MYTLAEMHHEALRLQDDEAFQKALRAFVREASEVLMAYYFCPRINGGVLLTHRPREDDQRRREFVLHIAFPPEVPDTARVLEMLLQLNRLHLEVRQFLRAQKEAELCLEMIFTEVEQVLRFADQLLGAQVALARDDEQEPRVDARLALKFESWTRQVLRGRASEPVSLSAAAINPTEPIHEVFVRQLQQARAFYERAAQQSAQGTYFIGMVSGVVVLVAIGSTGAVSIGQGPWLSSASDLRVQISLLVVSVLLGGLGAVVSVMQRHTSGTLSLRYQAGRWAIILSGAFRPIIGGVFAAVAFGLFKANLLPAITLPDATDAVKLFAFYGVIAFFAGFSERFAQDVLAAGQSALGGSGSVNSAPTPE